MTLDARRIALQGIGYAALFVALQGLVPLAELSPPIPGGGSIVLAPTEHRPVADLERLRAEDEIALAIIVGALQCGLLS